MNEINTIFYFPSSLTFSEYTQKLTSLEITSRTIVFAAAQNAIYMGGRQYGSYTNEGDVVRIIEEHLYDDTYLRNAVASLDSALQDANSLADSEAAKLQALINSLHTTIRDDVNSLFDDPIWKGEKLPTGSNFGQQEVEAYLQTIGVWEQNEAKTKTNATWSKIAQRIGSIELSVQNLWDAEHDNITNALVAKIRAYVQEGISTIDLSTEYAEKSAEDILVWLYSGLTAQTSANLTYSNLVSAAENGYSQAISNIATQILKLQNGDYLATSDVQSYVDGAIAGLHNSVTSNNAKTYIFTKITNTENDVDALERTTAALLSGFDGLSDDIAAIVLNITGDNSNTTIANKIGNWKAGLITDANLSSSSASLLAANADNTFKSGVLAIANGAILSAELVALNDFTSASVVALVNNAGSEVNINADKINLTGQTNFTSALAEVFTANKFLSKAVHANGVPQFYEMMDAENGFDVGMVSSDWNWTTNTGSWKNKFVHFHSTGQGELAGGVINWDNSGSNSNTKLNLGSDIGTVTLHAGKKWNKNRHTWTNEGVINIGTPTSYLTDQLTAQDVNITPETFSSVQHGDYTSYDNLLVDGKSNINVYGNLTMLTGSSFEVLPTTGVNKLYLNGDGIRVLNPGGTVAHHLNIDGHFKFGGILNGISMDGLDVTSDITAGYQYGNQGDIVSDQNCVWSYIDPSTIDAEHPENVTWSNRRDVFSNRIIGVTGIKEVVAGTTYFAFCGGIIICVGSAADCKTALSSTWNYNYLIRNKTVSSTDSDLGLISGTLALMA